MRFAEVNLFGLYVAPVAIFLVIGAIVFVAVRHVADEFGLPQRLWHPALFDLALYVILVSSMILFVAQRGLP